MTVGSAGEAESTVARPVAETPPEGRAGERRAARRVAGRAGTAAAWPPVARPRPNPNEQLFARFERPRRTGRRAPPTVNCARQGVPSGGESPKAPAPFYCTRKWLAPC